MPEARCRKGPICGDALHGSAERAESASGLLRPRTPAAPGPPGGPGLTPPSCRDSVPISDSPPRVPARAPISAGCDVEGGRLRTRTPPRVPGRGHWKGPPMSTAFHHSLGLRGPPAPGPQSAQLQQLLTEPPPPSRPTVLPAPSGTWGQLDMGTFVLSYPWQASRVKGSAVGR